MSVKELFESVKGEKVPQIVREETEEEMENKISALWDKLDALRDAGKAEEKGGEFDKVSRELKDLARLAITKYPKSHPPTTFKFTGLPPERKEAVEGRKFDLASGHLGNGLSVYNKAKEVGGDYEKIAHIDSHRAITWTLKDPPPEVKDYVEKLAKGPNKQASTSQPDKMVFHDEGVSQEMVNRLIGECDMARLLGEEKKFPKGWYPTHRITHEFGFDDVMEKDGVYYTADEWETQSQADWEKNEEGQLMFQGKPALHGSSIEKTGGAYRSSRWAESKVRECDMASKMDALRAKRVKALTHGKHREDRELTLGLIGRLLGEKEKK